VSIDGGAETKVDFYAATRAGDTLMYSSPILAQGSHTFKLRVTSSKNASSSGTTITVDRIDVR
jgi:mannan endo-1,4-beta-mannosidase